MGLEFGRSRMPWGEADTAPAWIPPEPAPVVRYVPEHLRDAGLGQVSDEFGTWHRVRQAYALYITTSCGVNLANTSRTRIAPAPDEFDRCAECPWPR